LLSVSNFINDFGSSEAPPTNAPLMFGWDINSSTFSGFTEPPYWIIAFLLVIDLTNLHASSACSAVAVTPVPIAQIGS